MTLSSIHHPSLSLIAGILILSMARLLDFIVAIYLIIIGLLGWILREFASFSAFS